MESAIQNIDRCVGGVVDDVGVHVALCSLIHHIRTAVSYTVNGFKSHCLIVNIIACHDICLHWLAGHVCCQFRIDDTLAALSSPSQFVDRFRIYRHGHFLYDPSVEGKGEVACCTRVVDSHDVVVCFVIGLIAF